MKILINPQCRRGFALITTISLLLLLTVVAVGFLALSSMSVRVARGDWALEEAQANARLALMVAIGELQRDLGPDQRVSASASIFDADPESETITGVRHPHWLVAWDTTLDESPDGTPWVRDDAAGGLRDLRYSGSSFDRESRLLNAFVSGGQGRRFIDPLRGDLGDEEDIVTLVGLGSVTNERDEVVVPRTRLLRDGQTVGSGAYWVTGLNNKALVNRPDQHRDRPLENGGQGLQRVLHAQDYALASLAGLTELTPDVEEKLVSIETLSLVSDEADDAAKSLFHDLTSWSQSILSDTKDGGLQRDLTAFFLSDGEIDDLATGDLRYLGLRDEDHLAGPANAREALIRAHPEAGWDQVRYRDISPTFGRLRAWARGAENTPFSTLALDLETGETANHISGNNSQNVYDGLNRNAPSVKPEGAPNLAPVIVETSLYYNLATYRITQGGQQRWRLRNCFYPRVTLWNPYNVDLECPAFIVQAFFNGHKDVRVEFSSGSTRTAEISIGNTAVNHLRGLCFFHLPATTLRAGEAMMFCPPTTRRYRTNNFLANQLSPSSAPSPDRYFWADAVNNQNQRITFDQRPLRFIESPDLSEAGNKSGADNYMAALKVVEGNGPITQASVAEMPLIAYVNQALQAGGSDELGVAWADSQTVPIHRLESSSSILPDTLIPDYRTRDGFRLRWWEEHQTNLAGAGPNPLEPQHLTSAALANWNIRAAYSCRNPFDNVTASPPHMFGIYTHDLWSESDVGWQAMMPRSGSGTNLASPFAPPSEGPERLPVFEVPRSETGISSLGYLRHLKTSEFIWHPTYAIGNSLADPRVELTGTNPNLQNLGSSAAQEHSGWNVHQLGWAEGRDSNQGLDYWSRLLRQVIYDTPLNGKNHPVYDLSYELNHSLWDRYFLGTGSTAERRRFAQDSAEHPLPNGRFSLSRRSDETVENLANPERAFFHTASELVLAGGFNVHSTSVAAWTTLLQSARDVAFSGDSTRTTFPRHLSPLSGGHDGDTLGEEAFSGFRTLSDQEIRLLAQEIVVEVKRRAPFFGLGDFINRRLVEGDDGQRGPIEAAILKSGLNRSIAQAYPLDNEIELSSPSFDSMTDTTRLENRHKPESTAWGIPGYLTQGDVVQFIGSSLRPRSDSFLIRTYGEALDAYGRVTARAWCEAIVQRTPEPILPDETGLNPVRADDRPNFGRRFRLVSFRWLDESEI